MIKNIFRLAIKNLINQKYITLINITGLCIALCTSYIILAWVINEKSYDRYNSKSERIYRFEVETGSFERNNHWHFARTHQKWRRKLPEYFPEIEAVVELAPSNNTTVKINNNQFYENAFCTDAHIFKVFDFNFISGDTTTALKDQHTLVVSESFANKHFKDTNPVGKTLKLNGSYIKNNTDYTITGVFKDIPATSHFHTNLLIKYELPESDNRMEWAFTYLLFKSGTDIENVKSKFPDFIAAHVPQSEQENNVTLHLTALTDIHLKSNIEREIEPNGDIKVVKGFIYVTIGLFVIALINFINLLTVSLGKRINNFNIQRIIGGSYKYSYYQLVTESAIIALIAVSFALLLFKPAISLISYLDLLKNLEITQSIFFNELVISLLVIIIVSISGIIPILLIRLKKTRLLNNNNPDTLHVKQFNILNKPLLVLQFALSIFVITCSIVFYKQNNFLFSKNLGYKEDNIILINRNLWSAEDGVIRLKNEFLKNPFVEEYSAVMDEPSNLIKDARRVKSSILGPEYTDYALTIFPTDETLFNFFDIPLVAGKQMDPYMEGQKFEQYILNESAVKKLGIKNPKDAIGIDFKIKPIFSNIVFGGTVVGVVKDFNFTSLYHPIQPMVFFQKPIWQWNVLVKLVPGDFKQQISFEVS